MSVIIQAARMSKTFVLGKQVSRVLDEVDLSITQGDFAVVMGPSGAGKSTLLHALSGMDHVSGGSIFFSGVDITDLNERSMARFRRDHCGFVFQQIHLLDSLSVMDNLMAIGLLGSRKRKSMVERAEMLLAKVGIDTGSFSKTPSMLSGGEAQRVAIARALMNSPTVCFADEPTGQLNSENARRVLDLFSEINLEGQTIVMVTHDFRSALRGNRVIYLKDGGVAGELNLETYSAEAESRIQQLRDFLKSHGW